MKRSSALTTLSHDHHHALFTAKLLRDAAETEGETGEATAAFGDFWRREGARHFRIEEEVLLPGSGLAGPSIDPDVARMLDEHLAIRQLAARVLAGETSPEILRDLGESMSAHVRFEERELFPRIESEMTAEDLESLGAEIQAAERAEAG